MLRFYRLLLYKCIGKLKHSPLIAKNINVFKLKFIAFCDNPHAIVWHVLHTLTAFIQLIYLVRIYVLFQGSILLVIMNATIVYVFPGN